MRIRGLAVLLMLSLGACASRPGIEIPGDFETPTERGMFVALADVEASDAQRLAAMDAWDDAHARLQALTDETDRLMQDWRELDRRDPAYTKRAAAMAQRYGELAGARMSLAAKFDARLANVLTERQWDTWQKHALRPASGFDDSSHRRRRSTHHP